MFYTGNVMSFDELKQIGPYEIRDVLGRGGMAVVYRAYQPNLAREVAVKVITAAYTADPSFVQRFQREARAIASLRHPNILTIHDFGQEPQTGQYYIVTELIEGKTLSSRLGQPLDPRWAAKIITQIAGALEYAHESNIVHRDVKPSNILMDRRDRAVLSDFGIAKLMQDVTNLTNTGGSVGTPSYMSPEQGLGEKIDGQSDQYSLGVVLYQMLTGTTPFRADTPVALLMAHVSRPLPDPRIYNPRLSPAIVAVLQRVLAKNPADRYPTIEGFAQAFEAAVALDNSQPAGFSTAETVGLGPDMSRTVPIVPSSSPPGNATLAATNLAIPPSDQSRPDQPRLEPPSHSRGGFYRPESYTVPTPPPASDFRVVSAPPTGKSRRSWLPLALGGLLVVLIAIIVGTFLVLSANSKPVGQVAQTTNPPVAVTATASTAALATAAPTIANSAIAVSPASNANACPPLPTSSVVTPEAGQGLMQLSFYDSKCKSAQGGKISLKVYRSGDPNTAVAEECCSNSLQLKLAPATYDLEVSYTSNVKLKVAGIKVTSGQTTAQTIIFNVGQLNFDFVESQGKSAVGGNINLKLYKHGDHNTPVAEDCCQNKLQVLLLAGLYDAVVGYANGVSREIDSLEIKEGQNVDQTVNFGVGHLGLQVLESQAKPAQGANVNVKLYKQSDPNTVVTEDCCKNTLDIVLPTGTYMAEVSYANGIKQVTQNIAIKEGQVTSQTVNLGVGRVALDVTQANGQAAQGASLSVKVYKRGDRDNAVTEDCCTNKFNLVLPPGVYELEVTSTNGNKLVGAPLEVKEGQTVTQTIKV